MLLMYISWNDLSLTLCFTLGPSDSQCIKINNPNLLFEENKEILIIKPTILLCERL